ncbi:major facilitator superfamily domain-containing protein [Cercophora scortea]|uniref:Major facilitator superfamily domain-containing protein n=1 Tax=Cercophora scortea TaxID=314031 RepID=A0AAE0IEB9_9PEZI|nr:major facilitator superfamily domain-containing protein [Cercophora scortea]
MNGAHDHGIGNDDDSNGADVTEATGLLGNSGSGSGSGDDDSPRRQSTWVGLEDFDHLPRWRRPSVWWLLGPYSLFTLAFGASLVPKLYLLIDLICTRYFADRSAADPDFVFTPIVRGGNNEQCQNADVQRQVAAFTLIISVMVGSLSSITAPKLGAFSDRYGRKRMMVICSFGGVVGEVVTILAAKYPETVHYNWILFGSFFDGLSGSFTAGSVLSHSYTSDCTPPSKRGVSIGYLHSCLFTGLALGPLMAGYLIEWTNSLVSIFYITLGCHVWFILFIYFVIPESLSKKRQHIAREKYAKELRIPGPVPGWATALGSWIPFGGSNFSEAIRSLNTANPFAPLAILFPRGPGSARLRRNLITLAIVDMAILGATMSSGTVTILYTEYVFGWGTFESSRFISLTSFVRVFVLMGIFPIINYIFRSRHASRLRRESNVPLVETNAGADEVDIWILRAALLSDVIGVTGYVFVRSSQLFVVCAIITAFGGLGSATIQAILSKHVPAERVGQLLGATGLLHALSRIIAPIIFNGLYAATIKTFPQAFFVLLASVFAAALLGTFLLRPHVFMTEDDEPAPPPRDNPRARQEGAEDAEIIPGL